ncbi:MAG: hypothetical protein N2652_05710 [Kiritimatiellae bacterium]|nr:hypothetical protein [Kiritimatiellia bacterium]
MKRRFIEPDDDVGGPCEVHGQQGLAVCALCAAEFCAMCFPGSEVCPQCAAEAEEPPLDEELDEEGEDLWFDNDSWVARRAEEEELELEDMPPDEDEDASRRW